MPDKLKRVNKNDSPTLANASEANKLIDAINKIYNLRIMPPSIGVVRTDGSDFVLDLSRLTTSIESQI